MVGRHDRALSYTHTGACASIDDDCLQRGRVWVVCLRRCEGCLLGWLKGRCVEVAEGVVY